MEDPKDVLRKAWREMNITSIEYHDYTAIVDQFNGDSSALSTWYLGRRLKKPTAAVRKRLKWMEAAGIVEVCEARSAVNNTVWRLAIRPISG